MSGVLCRYTTHDPEIARRLGLPSHVNQVRVAGIFASRAAFARAVVDAGLGFGAATSVLRTMRTYDQQDDNPRAWDRALYAPPGVLFVEPLNPTRGTVPVRLEPPVADVIGEPTYNDGVAYFDAPIFDVAVDATSSRRPASIILKTDEYDHEFTDGAAGARRLAAVLNAAADLADQGTS